MTEFDRDYEDLCTKMDQIKIVTEKMIAQVETLIQPNPSESWVYGSWYTLKTMKSTSNDNPISNSLTLLVDCHCTWNYRKKLVVVNGIPLHFALCTFVLITCFHIM